MKKICNAYHFTVEGETEEWYLEWLQKEINAQENLPCSVCFKIKKISPTKYAKQVVSIGKLEIYHLCDRESEEEKHKKGFELILKNMRDAELSGKKIKYHLSYCNFTFELCIILHKTKLAGALNNRFNYLSIINSNFNEKFLRLDAYKQKANFARVLSGLDLQNVKQAICNAKDIAEQCQKNGYTQNKLYGQSFYTENPSLNLHEAIEKILVECGALCKKK